MQLRDDITKKKGSRDDASRDVSVVVFWDGGSLSRRLPPEGRLVVGRADDCDIRVPDDSVSRHHAVLHAGTPPQIEDLGSANGTYLGGCRLRPREAHALTYAAAVELGDAVLVVRSGTLVERVTGPPRAASPSERLDVSMARALEIVDLVAATGIPVLILGETGSGKGVIADTLHRKSTRTSRPFVRLNCAALPDPLLESELFGHERGAFTGAIHPKPGILEAADGGTVLLDEIGDMALPTQAKLLHVLEHGEVMRLGAVKPRRIDVRFLAATHNDLKSRVAEGTFRQDLFFRLNGVEITVPPLRERPAEIDALASAFVAEACAGLGRPCATITEEAFAVLAGHGWPGNVRELRHVMVRACLFAKGGTIGAEHFDLAYARGAGRAPPSDPPLRGQVRDIEKRRILDALGRCAGNQTHASKALGISRGTLRSRMQEFGLLPAPRRR